MNNPVVNLTPNPRILATIAQNPMKPIDALSELLDNSLDGFAAASDSGHPILNPTVTINIPSINEINSGIGVLRVSDNGTGLSREQAINAVTAGFSGQDNPIDRLGLFGMGFNISTAKLGRQTKFITHQRSEQLAHSILIDIPEMMERRNFDAPIEELGYIDDAAGTVIEISKWWQRGSQNDGFIQSLAKQSKPKLREQIGRRYSNLIEKGYKIIINGEACLAYRHCAWTDKRYVEHRDLGKIYAKTYIDEMLGQEYRCSSCWTQLDNGEVHTCPNCAAENSIRVINRRIKGWVGIQRFDDASAYGIDLIRNGRVIRDSEKDAFFTFRSEDGEEIKDYPIDSQYGRIIGSIEINHVPVNYLKTDFDRTSAYWQEIIDFLRGKTSLQPNRAAEDGGNDSIVYRLYQGYRKVRQAGTKDLYMGTYNTQKGKSERVSREIERQYLEKFKLEEPGYGYDDDSEWYRRVLEAEVRPIIGFIDCPEGHNNPLGAEECAICGHLFKKKTCVNSDCAKDIPESAYSCPHCGTEQIQGVEEFWTCSICNAKNAPTLRDCTSCGSPIGAVDPFNRDQLLENSDLNDDLSITQKSLRLPDGEYMYITARVHLMKQDQSLTRGGLRIPIIAKHSSDGIELFIDQTHPAFVQYQDRHEDYIAIELANYVVQERATRIPNAEIMMWTVPSMYFYIHDQIWKERTRLDHSQLVSDINQYFTDMTGRLSFLLGDVKDEIFNDLTSEDKQSVYNRAVRSGQSSLDDLERTGKYLSYVPEETAINLVRRHPEHFFDGQYWVDKYQDINHQLNADDRREIQKGTLDSYVSSLEDIANYRRLQAAPLNPQVTNRAYSSLSILTNGTL
jgi:hypothetical protein